MKCLQVSLQSDLKIIHLIDSLVLSLAAGEMLLICVCVCVHTRVCIHRCGDSAEQGSTDSVCQQMKERH